MKKTVLQLLKQMIGVAKKSNTDVKPNINGEKTEMPKSGALSRSLDSNIQKIQAYLGHSDDLYIRYFELATLPCTRAAIIFIDTLVEQNTLESSVLTPLTQGIGQRTVDDRAFLGSNIHRLIKTTLSNSNIIFINDITVGIEKLLLGKGILLIDKYESIVAISIPKDTDKKHTEPQSEKVVRGPQQGFVEDIIINTYMIRKRIKSPNLLVKDMNIGKASKTQIRVIYIHNIVTPSIVEELFKRLERIDVDGIIGSAAIEEYINDAPTNLFQTTFYTERPDRAQSMLLEGRICVICDGTPFVIILPAIISDFFISSDDYYQNPYFATFNRFISYLGGFMLTFLPAFYIAVITFHHEILPTTLALTIAGAREGVPFPAFVEALLMEVAFEGLRQAGIRLPNHIGQAVSIVGALIIGQSAVEAGIVSSAVVIVVATTAIFSFAMPYTNFTSSLRIVRFFMMALAATLGIYGIMTGALVLALNLISLRSLGIPFMTPFAPLSIQDMKDWVLRFPQWAITKRSPYIVKQNIQKKSKHLKPRPNTNERRK